MHELVPELIPALEIEDARQSDVIHDSRHDDGDKSDQSKRCEHGGRAAPPHCKEQRRRADDQVRLDREERKGVEGTLNWGAKVARAVVGGGEHADDDACSGAGSGRPEPDARPPLP
jgi:hypothetical protein